MRKFSTGLFIGAGVIAIAFLLMGSTPLRPNPITYQYGSGTSGGGTTVTLTKAAISGCINNTDTTVTNTLSVKLNSASNDAIVLGGGEHLCLDHSDGYVIQSFVITAVNGTPAYKYAMFEMP